MNNYITIDMFAEKLRAMKSRGGYVYNCPLCNNHTSYNATMKKGTRNKNSIIFWCPTCKNNLHGMIDWYKNN